MLGDGTGVGRDDLVVGTPGQRVAGQIAAGSVVVLPGSTSGFIRSRSQLVSLGTPGVPGTARAEDLWPQVLTVRDTSGDGTAEVYAALSPSPVRAAVYQIPGSRTGIVPRRRSG